MILYSTSIHPTDLIKICQIQITKNIFIFLDELNNFKQSQNLKQEIKEEIKTIEFSLESIEGEIYSNNNFSTEKLNLIGKKFFACKKEFIDIKQKVRYDIEEYDIEE